MMAARDSTDGHTTRKIHGHFKYTLALDMARFMMRSAGFDRQAQRAAWSVF